MTVFTLINKIEIKSETIRLASAETLIGTKKF